METITATFQNGIFAPDQTVDLDEGTRVTLHVEPAMTPATTKRSAFSPLVPDEPLKSDDRGAHLELPMPAGAVKIHARDADDLLPDPPILFE